MLSQTLHNFFLLLLNLNNVAQTFREDQFNAEQFNAEQFNEGQFTVEKINA